MFSESTVFINNEMKTLYDSRFIEKESVQGYKLSFEFVFESIVMTTYRT